MRFLSFSFEFMFYLMIILVVFKNAKIRTLYIPWLCKFLINILRGSLLSVWIWKVFRQVPSDQFHYLNYCCGLTIWWTTGFPRGGFWQENPFTVFGFYKSITGLFQCIRTQVKRPKTAQWNFKVIGSCAYFFGFKHRWRNGRK